MSKSDDKGLTEWELRTVSTYKTIYNSCQYRVPDYSLQMSFW